MNWTATEAASRTEPWLIVLDDNPGDARLISEAISRSRPEVRIEILARSDVLLARLQDLENSPDATLPALLFVDVNVPPLSGHIVLSFLRTNERLGAVPSVVLSGALVEEDRQRFQASGASDVLAKPATFAELRHLVDLALDRFLPPS
ncbi:MAG: response regulator [Planctomycetes bacterium]|nr:response regulator [Planctomycetota bacterium]